MPKSRRAARRLAWLAPLLTIAFLVPACSHPSNNGAPAPEAQTATIAANAGTAAAGAGSTPSSSPVAAPATPLSQQQLNQIALAATDLPVGFSITASGPGGPELGADVLASYQEEFQQRDVTSTQSLQQTIVVIALLGQYRDTTTALAGIHAINTQTLNQILGNVSLTADAAPIPAIDQDSEAFHFTGGSNGTSVGGYLIVFHRGPIAALILTAAVQGSESLPQTIDLAQKQAQKLPALG